MKKKPETTTIKMSDHMSDISSLIEGTELSKQIKKESSLAYANLYPYSENYMHEINNLYKLTEYIAEKEGTSFESIIIDTLGDLLDESETSETIRSFAEGKGLEKNTPISRLYLMGLIYELGREKLQQEKKVIPNNEIRRNAIIGYGLKTLQEKIISKYVDVSQELSEPEITQAYINLITSKEKNTDLQ